MRLLIQAAIIAVTLAAAPSALAQALPDSVRSAGVTVSQWQSVQVEVRRAAAARGASERALAAVASRVSANLVQGGRIDLDQLLHSIDERAQQLADLQSQLAAMERADDPGVATLLGQARAAIDAGDLTRGDQFLAQAAESDLAAIARDQARLAARQTRAASTIGGRGRLAYASADYLGAAALYARAAETVPESDRHARWQYRSNQSDALQERGRLFGERAQLQEAARLYREVVLPLAPRATRPDEWAETQNNMGTALRELGESGGDDQALRDAVAAFRDALEVNTRENAPTNWAALQSNLGTALRELGERGDGQALLDAIAAYRAALEVQTRESDPLAWATTQNNLANALTNLGERGDERAMRDAIAAFRAALEVFNRESYPEYWALTQGNLGSALERVGRSGDKHAVHEAIAAFRAQLEVSTRERFPVLWAAAQNNLGNALSTVGRDGDDQALRDAVAAFRDALEVDTRENAPARWARDQNNLGVALSMLGERGDDQALRDAIVAFNAALEVRNRATAPADWAQTQLNLASTIAIAVERGDRAQIPAVLAAARAALAGFQEAGNASQADLARRWIALFEAM